MIFQKTVTSKEIAVQVERFDGRTSEIVRELDERQGKVAAALARGEDCAKLIRDAAALRVELDSRPLAREALLREQRRCERTEKASAARAEKKAAEGWTSDMRAAGAGVVSALGVLATALEAWNGTAEKRPSVAMPDGDLAIQRRFYGALHLLDLPDALARALGARMQPARVRGVIPATAEATVQAALETIARDAIGRSAAAIREAEAAERDDDEVIDEPEPAVAGK